MNSEERTVTGGKSSTIAILRVLERYSGEGHKLSQQDIIHYVKNDYNLDVDRKTVGRTIKLLKNFRFRSQESEFAIESGNGNGVYMRTNNNESKIALRSAITAGNKVRFVYYLRDLDGKEVRDDKPDHPNGEFVVDPYEIISSMGHEYLVCHKEGDVALRNLRIDRMKDVEVLKEQRMALQDIDGYAAWVRFNKEEYLKKLNYHMLGGKVIAAEFKIPGGTKDDMQRAVNILWDELSGFDGFGMRKVGPDGWIKVSVRMTELGAKVFARQFADMCTLIYPESTAKALKEEFAFVSAKYVAEVEKI